MSRRSACFLGRDWVGLLFLAGVVLFSLKTGPCYDDDCSNPGEGWCSGETATACEGAGRDYAYWIGTEDCAAEGLRCVEGTGAGYRGPNTRLSWCVDFQACSTSGSYRCMTSSQSQEVILARCTPLANSSWYIERGVQSIRAEWVPALVLDPIRLPGAEGTEESEGTTLPCASCLSSCGCVQGFVCRDRVCVPNEVAGENDDALVCCGGERTGSCPKGAACEKLDGSQAVCTTSSRCDECENHSDCESKNLRCVATSARLPLVCLAPTEQNEVTFGCRTDLSQAWSVDVCGRWAEQANERVVGFKCREGTDQSWGYNACDAWVELAGDCGEGFRCQDNQCIKRVPEIEVSPTLLDFGEVALGTEETKTFSIGNLGDWPLTVSAIEIQSETADLFVLSHPSLQVEPDEIATVQLAFAPSTPGNVSAKVLVRSDDMDEETITILVNGKGK